MTNFQKVPNFQTFWEFKKNAKKLQKVPNSQTFSEYFKNAKFSPIFTNFRTTPKFQKAPKLRQEQRRSRAFNVLKKKFKNKNLNKKN